MEISARIQQLEDMVKEAKTMPLSSSALVNREEMLELLEAARNEVPDEVRQARWMVKDREELLAKARRDADSILEKAEAERDRMVSEEQVLRSAQEEADQVLTEAREQARQIRLEAEDYVDARLAQFQIALERTRTDLERSISQVQRGREKLRGTMPNLQEPASVEHVEEER